MDKDLPEVRRIAQEAYASPTPITALFCEFPSNPLLRSPNLAELRKIADEYNFLIVVDETIGNFVNVDVLRYADIVVSSITKVFSGETNVMGGRYERCRVVALYVAHSVLYLLTASC